MREPFGPRERAGTPDDAEKSASPDRFQAQRPLEQFIATTLHEIQDAQSRYYERTDGLTKTVEKLGDKIDRLSDASLLSGATLSRIEPQVDAHNHTLVTVKGIVIGLSILVTVAGLILTVTGAILYWTNADRLDKLIKVLDSPGVEKILKKDSK